MEREVKTFWFSITVTSIKEVILITKKVTALPPPLFWQWGEVFGVISKTHCSWGPCCWHMEGLSTVSQSQNSWAQKGQLETVFFNIHDQRNTSYSKLSRKVFSWVWKSIRMEIPQFLQAICSSSIILTVKIFFLVFKLISCISICDQCLLSCYWAPLEECDSIFFTPPSDIYTLWKDLP